MLHDLFTRDGLKRYAAREIFPLLLEAFIEAEPELARAA